MNACRMWRNLLALWLPSSSCLLSNRPAEIVLAIEYRAELNRPSLDGGTHSFVLREQASVAEDEPSRRLSLPPNGFDFSCAQSCES